MGMGVVASGGTFGLPLFHGTSDFFATQIMNSGLGAANPIAQLGAVSLADDVVALMESLGIGISMADSWYTHVRLLRQMSQQRVSEGGFNWRHGGVYVTLTRHQAIGYARNAKGSELLTSIAELLALAPHLASRRLLRNYPEIRAVLGQEHAPVLIRAQGVQVSAMRTERGQDPSSAIADLDEHFDSIRSALERGRESPFASLHQFEIVQVVPPSQLELEILSRDELEAYTW